MLIVWPGVMTPQATGGSLFNVTPAAGRLGLGGHKWSTDDPDWTTLDLPSNGWESGQWMMAMQVQGKFHSAMTENGVEALVGKRKPTTWPLNYTVCVAPTELIGPDRDVVAEEGDEIRSGGGFSASDREHPMACS
jgi:hypothetical protein